ncbi:MAG: hypothetical protein P8Y01_01605 [Woeseiaceae bacterium]|jgi:hypothetical protein
MYRLRLTLLLMCFALAPALAQDSESEVPADQEVEEAVDEETSAADEVTDEEIEELLGLDEEYTELEDDFDPTEEVRFEQSIPFPTDI